MKTYTISSFIILSITFLLIGFCSCTSEKSTELTFYIIDQADFDQYKDSKFSSGSTILFAQGKVFDGQFAPKGSGTADSPIKVTAFDPESGKIYWDDTGKKPLINGNGKVNSAVYLYNGQHWEINNLELTNTDGTKEDQGDLRGIYIVAENSGTMENIVVRNCYVHDVNGEVGGKMRGGIHIHVLGDSVKTKFHDLVIENNVVENVGGVGIGNQSSWPNIDENEYYPWTGVVIRGNRVERTGRNGIIVRYSIDPLVEYNVLAYNSRHSTGHSIFNFNTIGCIVQFNEAYGNTSNNPDDIDHGGFDADYNSRGTIIQYNYSHDNNWFCGIMRRGVNTDITIRYNISQNELLGAYLYGFPTETGVEDVKIYNNTHYFGKGKGNRVFVAAGKFRTPTETVFRNNFFYFEDEAEWGFEPDNSCSFENNLFYNVSPRGDDEVTSDPLFVNPGVAGTDIDMHNPERLSGYKLKENSPCVGAAVTVNKNGGEDFWGNALYKDLPDIGAYEQ